MAFFLGTLMPVGFGFAQKGWSECNGQLLAISQNPALFSLIGTTYGGNGTTTFALPDLRGRAPLGAGTGPGLSAHSMGAQSGSETVTLLTSQMPNHGHTAGCTTTNANVGTPVDGLPATDTATAIDLWNSSTPNSAMNPQMVSITGGSQPHNNLQPYLAVTWVIAVEGEYPERP